MAGPGADEPAVATPRWRSAAAFLFACCWMFPVNFVRLEGLPRIVYPSLLAAGAACALLMAGRRPLILKCLTWVVVALLFSLIQGGAVQNGLLLVGQVGAGLAVGLLARRPLVVVSVLLAITTTTLLIDWTTGTHWYASNLGASYFQVTDATFGRAQGVIGHPVPAAFLTLTMVVVCWSKVGEGWPATLRRSLLLILAVVGVLSTQTRSALLVGSVLMLGALARELIHVFLTGRRLGAVIAWLAVIAAALGGVFAVSAQGRLFEFADIQGSQSYLVRANGLSAIRTVWDHCSVCVVIGHGQGSLQEHLTSLVSIDQVRTVDDIYLTTFWDFGLLGVFALLAVVLVSVRAITKGVAQGPAWGLICLSLAGLFYDTAFLSTGAMLYALLLAWLYRERVADASTRGKSEHFNLRGDRHVQLEPRTA